MHVVDTSLLWISVGVWVGLNIFAYGTLNMTTRLLPLNRMK
jgi:hypothetical protein